MRRPGSPQEYREMVTRMRELVPDISLRTTFITGHPGETPKDFGELYDFVEWAQFDQMGAFVYSPEESTIAARMADIPTRKTAERRREKLMELQQEISRSRNESEDRRDVRRASSPASATRPSTCWKAASIGQAPEIDGRLLINDGIELLPADLPAFARVEITDAHPVRCRRRRRGWLGNAKLSTVCHAVLAVLGKLSSRSRRRGIFCEMRAALIQGRSLLGSLVRDDSFV